MLPMLFGTEGVQVAVEQLWNSSVDQHMGLAGDTEFRPVVGKRVYFVDEQGPVLKLKEDD